MAEQPNKKAEIPARLLDGLKNIELTGAVPMLIPQVLESFLTEQGIYSSSMTPTEAWNTLRLFRDDEYDDREPFLIIDSTPTESEIQAQPSPGPTPEQPIAPAPPVIKPASPLIIFRRKKKQGR